MSRAQGDGWKTWTDVEMNNRIKEHDEKWDRIIKPYYDSLVGEKIKEFEILDTNDMRVIIKTRQYNKVECIGKTRFYKGTLRKEDYIIKYPVYIITGITIDKKTGEENYLDHSVFKGADKKNEANEYFKQLKNYYE